MANTNYEVIHQFLVEEVLQDKDVSHISEYTELLESELLDSIAIMQIVAFIEQVFECEVPEDMLLPENFASIHSILVMISKL